MLRVATGLASGPMPTADLAASAVSQAMRRLDMTVANSVLLFLTSEFGHDPLPAIRSAAKAASCTQVMGCSAPGIFTQEDWVLDTPAAAAMVFGGNVRLAINETLGDDALLFTLTAPHAINTNWLSNPGKRFGGVAGDALGRGPFSVWQNAKGMVTGFTEAALLGVEASVSASHGLHIAGRPQLITCSQSHHLSTLDGNLALESLRHAFPETDPLPLHLLMAVYADSPDAISRGEYSIASLVSGNENDGTVTLSNVLSEGQYLAWAIRDVESAQSDLKHTIEKSREELRSPPEFGLMFSCLGRGPYFYDGLDRDLMLVKKQFPDMPFIGFYGNGEIAPMRGENILLQYSAVLALFSKANDGSF